MKEFNIINKFFIYFVALAPYTEIVGNLSKIKNRGDNLSLIFIINKEIEIPESAINKDTVKKLIGRRVGIFNCGDGRFKVRKIK